ncbi:MAG: 16S rRNA (cytosine(967)-C(5))-methyltransferase RsmB [Parahaliea sp.]
MISDCRAAAARVISQVMAGQSLNQALPPQLDSVDERDRALLRELSYGCLRQWQRLDGLAGELLDKPLRNKDNDIRALILIGLHQLTATRIPDHAAVASTVGATRTLSKAWARGLVNATLRRFLRERETLEARLSDSQQVAHPDWLYHRLQAEWPQQAQAILAANNSHPPMTLRVNAQRDERSSYQQTLTEHGIASRPGTLSDNALYLEQALDVSQLPSFDNGHVSVQDEAAQLAAVLLAAQPGQRVLDACAAPGGKSCHILERQPRLAELVAMDIDTARALRVQNNLERLKLAAELIVGDATSPPGTLTAGSFDHILADVPCSATGVIRRHPDIKLLRRTRDITQLAREQGRILDGLWPLLKPGGSLLYVTCSVLEEENSAVINAFLERQHQARLEMPSLNWGETCHAGQQLLPTLHGSDGLFFARLVHRN